LDIEEKITKTIDSMKHLLLVKNERYGNSALSPLSIFTTHVGKNQAANSILIRLDDKLSRVKNSENLKKNDISDLIGYLTLLCVNQGWEDFSDLID